MGESGINAVLSYCLTENGTYTALGTVKNFKPSGVEKKTIEVKALGIADSYIQYLAGFKDGGTVDFDMEHDDDEMEAVANTIFESEAAYWWKFTLDNGADANDVGTQAKFQAHCTKHTPLNTDDEGKIVNSASLKITGKPTFTGMTAVAGP